MGSCSVAIKVQRYGIQGRKGARGDDHGSNWRLKGTGVGRGEQNNQTKSSNLDEPSTEGVTSGAEPSEEALEWPTR